MSQAKALRAHSRAYTLTGRTLYRDAATAAFGALRDGPADHALLRGYVTWKRLANCDNRVSARD